MDKRPEGCKRGCREFKDCNGKCTPKKKVCTCMHMGRISRYDKCEVHR